MRTKGDHLLRKKLCINENPPIRTNQYNAYAESILYFHKDYYNWLANNYIELLAVKGEYGLEIEYLSGNIFGSIPMLEFEVIDKSGLISSERDVHSYLKERIDSNRYIYTHLDEYYVPNRIDYGKKKFIHDVLIYGYDLVRKTYYLIGYNDKRNYAVSEISFNKLYIAICNNNNCLININLNDTDYVFNKKRFLEMLIHYYDETNCFDHLNLYLDMKTFHNEFYNTRLDNSLYYGIGIYNCYDEFIEACVSKKSQLIDKYFYLLYEHKKSMLFKVKYLEDNNYINDVNEIKVYYNSLIHKTRILLYQSIKFNLNRNSQLLIDIKNNLYEIKTLDKKVVEKLISKIQ